MVLVDASQIPIGSTLILRTGDKVVADGVVVEGTTNVDESNLTGESVPTRKSVHDRLSGGSINVGTTRLIYRTTATVEDSSVARLIRLVEEAQANQSPTEKMIDRFARAYTPLVISVAAILCTIPWCWGAEKGREWAMNGLILVVIACPCALTISTPATYAAGLASTARRGIIVKSGFILESLGRIGTVVLDKTGTVTEGKFVVDHLELMSPSCSHSEMLAMLAAMEEPASHPLAATLVRAVRSAGIVPTKDMLVKQHTILKGEGIRADVNGKTVYVGNRRLFERLGMFQRLLPEQRDMTEKWSVSEGGTVGFLGIDGVGIVGAYSLTDRIRPEAAAVIAALHESGINVSLLSGDELGPALKVGAIVGIAENCIFGGRTPEDKLHFIDSISSKAPGQEPDFGLFQKRSLVLFCGEGVNDAAAIAAR
jgi:Zn2+/Cd2+-exporting ATPase